MTFQTIPFNDIRKFGQITMLEHGVFNISWIIDRFCNYKCSYCWPYANSQVPNFASLELYKEVIDKIISQANANGFSRFHWSFSGGEPTAYKHLYELIAHIDAVSNVQNSIHLTTNLSPSINYWNRWCSLTDRYARKSITASFHHEFANEDEFAEKILFLINRQVFVTVNQVMQPDVFWQTYERCERFRSRGINVTLKPQSNQTASAIVEGYSSEMINIMQTAFAQTVGDKQLHQIKLVDSASKDWYLDQAERFNAYNFNRFSGWQCHSGYQSIVIRENTVKRGYSCRDEILGTLENFNLFRSPQLCTTDTCVSSADSKIPKIKC